MQMGAANLSCAVVNGRIDKQKAGDFPVFCSALSISTL